MLRANAHDHTYGRIERSALNSAHRYSNIVATLAGTSSMTASGTLSSFLPRRAARSSAPG